MSTIKYKIVSLEFADHKTILDIRDCLHYYDFIGSLEKVSNETNEDDKKLLIETLKDHFYDESKVEFYINNHDEVFEDFIVFKLVGKQL